MFIKVGFLALVAFSMSGCGQFEGKSQSKGHGPSVAFKSGEQLDATAQFGFEVSGKWVQSCQKDDGSSTQKTLEFGGPLAGKISDASYADNETCKGTPTEVKVKSFTYELIESGSTATTTSSIKSFGVTFNFENEKVAEKSEDKAEENVSDQVETKIEDPVSETYNIVIEGDHLSFGVRSSDEKSTAEPIKFERNRKAVARSKRLTQ